MSDCTLDEIELYSRDPKYRSYSNAVEKILKNFDSSNEWADLISNLAKLEKVIEANNKYVFIPKRITVARRVAQCLHPNLPTGVHLKSLAVYNSLMQAAGKELARDLPLYCPAIFYLLPRSSFTVRPRLLDILDFYVVGYVETFPDLPALIASLFSSIEETSELSERILGLANRILQRCGSERFFTAGWTALLTTNECRLPFLLFIIAELDRGDFDNQSLATVNPDQAVNALRACLKDDSPHRLICRNALDLICRIVPINSPLHSTDSIKNLLSDAFLLLLLKESSLNRRILGWMLSADSWINAGSNLFVGALRKLIDNPTISSSHLISIVSTLLDQKSLTALVVDNCLIHMLFKLLDHCSKEKCKDENSNALASFLLSFDTKFLWTFMGDKFEEFLQTGEVDRMSKLCALTEHILKLSQQVLCCLCGYQLEGLLVRILKTCSTLVWSSHSYSKIKMTVQTCIPIFQTIAMMDNCFDLIDHNVKSILNETVQAVDGVMTDDGFAAAICHFTKVLCAFIMTNGWADGICEVVPIICQILNQLLMLPGLSIYRIEQSKCVYDLVALACSADAPFDIRDSAIRTLIHIVQARVIDNKGPIWMQFKTIMWLVQRGSPFGIITSHLWQRLCSSAAIRHQTSACELLVRLNEICPWSVCESVICFQLLNKLPSNFDRLYMLLSFLFSFNDSRGVSKCFERSLLSVLVRTNELCSLHKRAIVELLRKGFHQIIDSLLISLLFIPEVGKEDLSNADTNRFHACLIALRNLVQADPLTFCEIACKEPIDNRSTHGDSILRRFRAYDSSRPVYMDLIYHVLKKVLETDDSEMTNAQIEALGAIEILFSFAPINLSATIVERSSLLDFLLLLCGHKHLNPKILQATCLALLAYGRYEDSEVLLKRSEFVDTMKSHVLTDIKTVELIIPSLVKLNDRSAEFLFDLTVDYMSQMCLESVSRSTNIPSKLSFYEMSTRLTYLLSIILDHTNFKFVKNVTAKYMERYIVCAILIWTHCSRMMSTSNTTENIFQMELESKIANLLNGLICQFSYKTVLFYIITVWGSRRSSLKVRNSTTAMVSFTQKFLNMESGILGLTDIVADCEDSDRPEDIRRWTLQFALQWLSDIKQSNSSLGLIVSFIQVAFGQARSPPLMFLTLRLIHRLLTDTFNDACRNKIVKPLQPLFMSLAEAVNSVVASSLGPLSWLKRTSIVVRDGSESTRFEPVDLERTLSNCTEDMSQVVTDGLVNSTVLIQPKEIKVYSLQAIIVLSETFVPCVESGFKSDEKDRLISPIVQSICANLIPFLKTRRQSNGSRVRASSSFLRSLCSSPFTRKFVRKDTLDILFASDFFHLDRETLLHWCSIINSLSCHEKASFKDIIGRASSIQTGLFVSSDQENDQRGQMIRRVAFILFSSTEVDQYQSVISDIQDFLSDMLRLTQSPQVLSQVFDLVRCMVLRFSSKFLIAILPAIYTELVGIMLRLENELSDNPYNEMLSRLMINVSQSSLCTTSTSPEKCNLYLSAFKLLELLLSFPCDSIPQFQVYRYVFIPECPKFESPSQGCFVPYVTRIRQKLQAVVNDPSIFDHNVDWPVFSAKKIDFLTELYRPILALEKLRYSINQPNLRKSFECVLAEDFVDGWFQDK